MWNALSSGFAVSISLIFAIGAQNAFVLRQGLRGDHVLAVVLACAISDAILITIGVAGFSSLTEHLPRLAPVMRVLAAIMLVIYGGLNLRSAWRGGGRLLAAEGPPPPLWRTVTICLALTWLNPHVYLDTVLLVGSVSLSFDPHRLAFGIGAVAASFTFFFALGFGAGALRPVFAKPAAWRVLDVATGLLMWGIAVAVLRM